MWELGSARAYLGLLAAFTDTRKPRLLKLPRLVGSFQARKTNKVFRVSTGIPPEFQSCYPK